eukprot:6179070-Pleurochrysis_carterae.AAC.2
MAMIYRLTQRSTLTSQQIHSVQSGRSHEPEGIHSKYAKLRLEPRRYCAGSALMYHCDEIKARPRGPRPKQEPKRWSLPGVRVLFGSRLALGRVLLPQIDKSASACFVLSLQTQIFLRYWGHFEKTSKGMLGNRNSVEATVDGEKIIQPCEHGVKVFNTGRVHAALCSRCIQHAEGA